MNLAFLLQLNWLTSKMLCFASAIIVAGENKVAGIFRTEYSNKVKRGHADEVAQMVIEICREILANKKHPELLNEDTLAKAILRKLPDAGDTNGKKILNTRKDGAGGEFKKIRGLDFVKKILQKQKVFINSKIREDL